MLKKYIGLLLFILGGIFLFGCEKKDEPSNPRVKIVLEDNREIRLELYPDKAPQTVKNFLKLVDKRYYDGVVFHRNIAGFMIQTGGYYVENETIVEKDEVAPIMGEFTNNGFVGNDILHEPGVISMARTSDPNSASNQFFICSDKTESLDGNYAAFGKTIDEESTQLVIELSNAPTRKINENFKDFPYPTIVIKEIVRIQG